MNTIKIHLIRHGATDANYRGEYIGCRTDLPLAPEGLNELRLLKDDIEYPEIERLYSSPMLRAKQTGAVLYPEKQIVPVEELMEYDFGTAPPGGEENSDFIKRVCIGFNRITVDMVNGGYKSAAVIMHGGAIMMLLAAAGLPRRSPVEWTSENGRGYSLLVTPSLYFKSGAFEVYGII